MAFAVFYRNAISLHITTASSILCLVNSASFFALTRRSSCSQRVGSTDALRGRRASGCYGARFHKIGSTPLFIKPFSGSLKGEIRIMFVHPVRGILPMVYL